MKRTRHKITFLDAEDIEAVALAQLGMSNEVIQERSSLSAGQIQYRLTKAKRAEGLPRGQGYRSQWRNGTSSIARDVMQGLLPGLRRDVKTALPKHFVKPPAEGANGR